MTAGGLHAGETAGPYVLLDELGSGGMGVVYRAHDPRLDREVAVKLLRPDAFGGVAPGSARARLTREAQAMARLRHDNVVQVFDVGTTDTTVFVAMELVRGTTLGKWLSAKPRAPRVIMDVFLGAGRGLLAAHQQGLVHRDFKPDNVLVGNDGRVKVTDFGLVRAVSSSAGPSTLTAGRSRDTPEPTRTRRHDPGPAEPPSATGEAPLGHTALTGAGLVLGTPPYMAPEQHYGEATDPRTDQFAFCIALWEALAGRRPFKGRTARELAFAKQHKEIDEPDAGEMPAALRRALLRGLEPSIARRHDSLEPILAVLARPRRTRRVLGWGVGASVVAGVATWGLLRQAPPAAPCEGAPARVGEVWNEARRSNVATAMAATDLPYAADTWHRVETALSRRVAAWQDEHRATCEAGNDPQADPAALDRRMGCLSRRLSQLDDLVALLEGADAAIVERSILLAASLPPASRCRREAIGASDVPPNDRARALRDELARDADRGETLLVAGRSAEALALARSMLVRAGEDPWPRLRAFALATVCTTREANADYEGAIEAGQEAYWLAADHGDHDIAARSASELAWLHGLRRADREAARKWGRHARAAAQRGGGDPFIDAQVASVLGSMAMSAGDTDEALDHYRHALTGYRSHHGDEEHKSIAVGLSNLGAAHAARGDYDRAIARYDEALQMVSRLFGDEHPALADALDNRAQAAAKQGDWQAAMADGTRALQLRRNAGDPVSAAMAASYHNLGAFAEATGDLQSATSYAEQALAIYEQLLDDNHPTLAASRINLAIVLNRREHFDDAFALATSVRRTLAARDPDHPYLTYADVVLGWAALGRGERDVAREAAARVDARCRPSGGTAAAGIDESLCGEGRWLLARVTWPDDPPRARALARDARAVLARHAAAVPVLLEEIDTWLAEDGDGGH